MGPDPTAGHETRTKHPGRSPAAASLHAPPAHPITRAPLTADAAEIVALMVFADGPCQDSVVSYTPAP